MYCLLVHFADFLAISWFSMCQKLYFVMHDVQIYLRVRYVYSIQCGYTMWLSVESPTDPIAQKGTPTSLAGSDRSEKAKLSPKGSADRRSSARRSGNYVSLTSIAQCQQVYNNKRASCSSSKFQTV